VEGENYRQVFCEQKNARYGQGGIGITGWKKASRKDVSATKAGVE